MADACGNNTDCTDNSGSYTCECKDGYQAANANDEYTSAGCIGMFQANYDSRNEERKHMNMIAIARQAFSGCRHTGLAKSNAKAMSLVDMAFMHFNGSVHIMCR